MYYPFCLIEAFKNTKDCNFCKQQLHPDWWTSWGLGPTSMEMEKHAGQLGLEKVWETIKQSLQ
jgi:hypothetical protein